MYKQPDGSYRSTLDEPKGRFQMAAFHNNRKEADIREKGIFADAFLFFEPFAESMSPFVFTTYFATADSIWQYGFPDWALKFPFNESFDVYNWFYDADPVHDPGRGHIWTDMYYDAYQGQWMISSLMPIYDEDEFLGIVGQDFILQKIVEVTKRSHIGETGILFFIDNLGNIVAHPDTAYLIDEKAKNDEKLNLKTLPDVALTKVLQKLPNENYYTFTEEANRRIVMSFPLESVHWKMVYVVDEKDFLAIADRINRQYFIFFIVFALLVLLLLSLIIRFRASGPIKKFIQITTEISKGDLNKQVKIKSNDEIGELASAFNQMTQDLKKSREELEKRSKELKKEVKKRTKELDLKVEELERFNKLAVGRELKMVELKKRIRELEGKG
jgi:two-component system NtrC family sensor kinase